MSSPTAARAVEEAKCALAHARHSLSGSGRGTSDPNTGLHPGIQPFGERGNGGLLDDGIRPDHSSGVLATSGLNGSLIAVVQVGVAFLWIQTWLKGPADFWRGSAPSGLYVFTRYAVEFRCSPRTPGRSRILCCPLSSDAPGGLRREQPARGEQEARGDTLRHSAASLMLSAGVPLKVVSEVFCHTSVAITGDVYDHVSPDMSREALTRLSDALA
jgi:hypothetical protein